MAEIFISYARSTAAKAQQIAEALRGLGYGVWRDDELPAHRDYSEVIEERLRAAKAVVVVWSADAVKSQWVRAEADLAREAGTLVQLSLDRAPLPMPFNRIQCADFSGWAGDLEAPGWGKVAASVAELVGGVAPAAEPPPSGPPTIPPCPEVRYARSGSFDIAYMTLGQGRFDTVMSPGMWTHLEACWDAGVTTSGLIALGAFSRVITFDKRGQGMSDRMVGSPTLEERMDDIRAVMDAAGSRRALLWGASEGGPMSLLFAATYPDRVLGLVIQSSFARLDSEGETTVAQRLEVIPPNWGTGLSKDLIFGDFPEAALSRAAWAHIERLSSTPGNMTRQIELLKAIDVRAVLPAIRVPTLVLHREEDPLIPVERGRELAAGIPGARFVVGPGRSHSQFDDQGVMVGALGEFLASLAEHEAVDEQLATVLVCRGAGADADLRANSNRLRGKALAGPTGEAVYIFDGPTRAVECALANRLAAPDLSQGLALGIVALGDERVTGPATQRAAATAAVAGRGQVLMNRALGDVLAGARFRLEPVDGGDALYRVAV